MAITVEGYGRIMNSSTILLGLQDAGGNGEGVFLAVSNILCIEMASCGKYLRYLVNDKYRP